MLLREAGYRTAIAGKVGFVVKPNSGGKPDLPVADFDKWGGGQNETNYKTIKNKKHGSICRKVSSFIPFLWCLVETSFWNQ